MVHCTIGVLWVLYWSTPFDSYQRSVATITVDTFSLFLRYPVVDYLESCLKVLSVAIGDFLTRPVNLSPSTLSPQNKWGNNWPTSRWYSFWFVRPHQMEDTCEFWLNGSTVRSGLGIPFPSPYFRMPLQYDLHLILKYFPCYLCSSLPLSGIFSLRFSILVL